MAEPLEVEGQWLSTEVRLPRLPGPEALREIAEARIRAVPARDHVAALISDGAFERLYAFYRQSCHGSIRKVMFLLHTALSTAVDEEAERVDDAHVVAAHSRIGPIG